MTELSTALTRISEALATKQPDLFGKDFLLTWEQSQANLEAVLHVVEGLQRLRAAGRSPKLFDSGIAISYFRDFSTRTRYSFASACNLLGLEVMPIDENVIQVAHGETTRETAVMLSWLTDVIGIRDDIYLGRGHAFMEEFAQSITASAEEGVLPSRPTLVNLQSDLDHPTQSMSDLAHLADHFGGLDQLKGKKIAVTWAYSPSYGKPLSVAQGLVALLSRFGAELTLAHPEGYDLLPDIIETTRRQSSESGGSFEVTHSMEDAFRGADVVYPKSWAPMNIHHRRVELLESNGGEDELKALETECLTMNAAHTDWECDEAKMALTKGGEALYMHCLPADITGVSCEAGEVSDAVFSKHRAPTYKQAGYKPYVIAAMILLGKIADPSALFARWARDCPSRTL